MRGLSIIAKAAGNKAIIEAVVMGAEMVAKKISNEVDRSLMMSYIRQLHRTIKQDRQVIRAMAAHIKKTEGK